MLKLWGRKTSINVQKAMWALAELGLAYERVDVGGRFGGLDTANYAARNPNRLIPTLDDDGVTIWESHSILRYIAAKYGSGSLWAEDPAERSLADRWIDWTATMLQEAFISGVFWGAYRTPPEEQNRDAIAASLARTNQLLAILDRHLAGRPYVAGDRFTMGDIPPGAQLYRYFTLDIARPSLPHIEAWYEGLKARPAYRESVMIPYDELRGRAR